MTAAENRRPTRTGSGSFTVIRSSAVASSFRATPGAGAPRRRTSTSANCSFPPSAAHSIASAWAALAATSRPVSTRPIVLRYPPS